MTEQTATEQPAADTGSIDALLDAALIHVAFDG